MIRALALALIAAVTLAPAAQADSLPMQLKPSVTVTQDVIRVGDLWENAQSKAGLAVAQAPQPGKRVTLDARWLGNLAVNNGLDWRPASQFERAVVERAGQNVDVGVIEAELHDALNLEGLPATSTFEISNRQSLNIVIPTDAPATVAIKDVLIDGRTQRFTATVESPAGSPNAVRFKINGRTFATTRVPMLSRTMNRGEIITAQDVVWADMRDDNLRQDLVVDPKQIIGMEPRLLLRANTSIRTLDLQRPMSVSRNGLVTMMLQTPFMSLSAQGRAMEDGGVGDTVRVTNLQTKQVIEARVQGPGIVVVNAIGAMTAPRPQTAAIY